MFFSGSSKSAVVDQQPHSKAAIAPKGLLWDGDNDDGYLEICQTNRTILRSDEIMPKEINSFFGHNDNFLALVNLFPFCCCLEFAACYMHDRISTWIGGFRNISWHVLKNSFFFLIVFIDLQTCITNVININNNYK